MDVFDVNLEPDLTYSKYPIRVFDQKDRVTRKRTPKFYKVQWNQQTEEEATWEYEDFLEKKFLSFQPPVTFKVFVLYCKVRTNYHIHLLLYKRK
jgi:hypothetical protein